MPVERRQLYHVRGVLAVPVEVRGGILLDLLNVVYREALALLDHLEVAGIGALVLAAEVARDVGVRQRSLEADALAAGKCALEELQAIKIVLRFLYLVEFGEVLANVVADAELALRRHDLVELLVLQLLSAERIVALDLAALLLVCIDFRQGEDLRAELAGNPK